MYTWGSAHTSSPDTGPAPQMVQECSPSTLALWLPTLQMAGEAGEGPGGWGQRSLSSGSLHTGARAGPGEALPVLHQLVPTLQALSSPSLQLTDVGKKGRQLALAVGEVAATPLWQMGKLRLREAKSLI